MFLGEMLGTFSLIFLGIGSCLYSVYRYPNKKVNYFFIGLKWGAAIFIANVIGILIGSNKLNPIFSLIGLLFDDVRLYQFFLEILGQVIGAYLAMISIHKISQRFVKKEFFHLNQFAPMSIKRNLTVKVLSELVGTSIMVFTAKITSFSDLNKIQSAIIISLLMAALIMIIAPITGASFNPVRDIIPRIYYKRHMKINKKEYIWDNVFLTSFVPIIAGILTYAAYIYL